MHGHITDVARTASHRAALLVVLGLAALTAFTAAPGHADASTTQTPWTEGEGAAALEAVLIAVNGVLAVDEQHQVIPDCQHGSGIRTPEGKACVYPRSSADHIRRGIALFGAELAHAVVARGRDGVWRYWLSTQGTYLLLTLPGEMLVCADGEGLNVRAEPDINAPIVGGLADLTRVRGEEFVLTEPGNYDPRRLGSGWYRLSAPVEGWVHSHYVPDAERRDCQTRDGQLSQSG
jgi:hypothetical protein